MLKIISKTLLIILILSFLVTPNYAIENSYTGEIRVLIIHSYNRDYQWTRDIDRGIENVFEEANVDVKLFYEYMDTKNYPFDQDVDNVHAYLDNKYQDERFDIIIVSDNQALYYVDQSKISTFDNVPIIATAINGDISYRSLNRDIVLLYEVIDYTRFFKALQTLHPNKERVQLIFDDITPTSRYVMEDVKSFAFLTGFEVNIITSGRLDQIANQIDKEAILVFGLYFGDEEGNTYKATEALEYLSESVDQPFYVFWDFLINHGGLGGYVLEAEQFGRVAAKEALTIMFDAPKADLRVTSGFKFDYELAKKYNINVDSLIVDYKWVNRASADFIFRVELLISAIVILALFIMQVHFWRHSKKRDLELEALVVQLEGNSKEQAENLKRFRIFMDMCYTSRKEDLLPIGEIVRFMAIQMGLSNEKSTFLETLWLHYHEEFPEDVVDFKDKNSVVNLVVLKERVEKSLSGISKKLDRELQLSMYHALIHQYTRYNTKSNVVDVNIPIEARILSVANALYQFTSNDVQDEPLAYDDIIIFINKESGQWFDPEVVNMILNHQGEIYRYLYQERQLEN